MKKRKLVKKTRVNAPKIGVIGIGMVGDQVRRYFADVKGYKRGSNLFLYDIDPKKFYSDDVNKADIIFICVPTPRAPGGECNTSAVESAFKMVKTPRIVVLKSTVPPGTTEKFQKKYPKHKVLFNPEYLTESQAWEDMINPQIQIVGFTHKSRDAAQHVLDLLPKAPFMSPWGNGYKKHFITATEAELIKVFTNAFFSCKVTFANLLADACERVGADYENVRAAMGSDYRIGPLHMDVYHRGYRGFGGYCLPKDLDAAIAFLKEKKVDTDIFETVRARNVKLLARQGLTIESVSGHNGDT